MFQRHFYINSILLTLLLSSQLTPRSHFRMHRPRVVTRIKSNLTGLQKSRSGWFTNLFQNTGTVQQRQEQRDPTDQQNKKSEQSEQNPSESPTTEDTPTAKKKSTTQLDEELRQKMAGLSGDGGEAGVSWREEVLVASELTVTTGRTRERPTGSHETECQEQHVQIHLTFAPDRSALHLGVFNFTTQTLQQ